MNRRIRFVLGSFATLFAASVGSAACSSPFDADAATQEESALGGGAACPVQASISQYYHAGHDGVDLAAPMYTPIYATGAGVVEASGPAQGYGQWIRIRHDDGSMTEYGHMVRRDVFVGQRVEAGQVIAAVGTEGQSSGPHLHLRTYARAGDGHGIDPIGYLGARGLSLPCQAGTTGTGGGGGACSVRDSDKKLYCANKPIEVREHPWASSAVVDRLTTTNSWFSCYWEGERHQGGNSIWYWTKGDVDGREGFVPASAVHTPNDPAPGLIRCGDTPVSSTNGECFVSASDKKLHCANEPVEIREHPWASSAVVDRLTTTKSWFSCYWEGEPHRGGNSIWYWTKGDLHGKDGFVPAYAVHAKDDPVPGLPRCGD